MSSHFLLQRIFSLQGSNLDPEILLNFRQICYHLSHQKIPGYIIFAVVVQSLSHVWLWNPMDCTMPGFPVLPHLPELAQLRPTELVMPSNHLLLCHPLLFLLSIFPASGSFLMSWLFTSVGQIIGASASASVLPMNIQDWFPLELTGLISLQLMGLSSHWFPCSPRDSQVLSCPTLVILKKRFSQILRVILASPQITPYH